VHPLALNTVGRILFGNRFKIFGDYISLGVIKRLQKYSSLNITYGLGEKV
jgi:hypothetical protein